MWVLLPVTLCLGYLVAYVWHLADRMAAVDVDPDPPSGPGPGPPDDMPPDDIDWDDFTWSFELWQLTQRSNA